MEVFKVSIELFCVVTDQNNPKSHYNIFKLVSLGYQLISKTVLDFGKTYQLGGVLVCNKLFELFYGSQINPL